MMRPFYCRIVVSPVDPNLRRTPAPRVSQVVATGNFEREHGGGGRHSRRREHRATDLKQPQRSSERQSTRGFDAGFLDPTGYLMTVHARRREVDDDERRMSGSIHCTVLEGYVFFFDARRTHASGARWSSLAGRRFFRNDERQRTPHLGLGLRVFYHGTYGEINSALIAAGAAAQPSRRARHALAGGVEEATWRIFPSRTIINPPTPFLWQAPASARIRSSPLYLDQQAAGSPFQGH